MGLLINLLAAAACLVSGVLWAIVGQPYGSLFMGICCGLNLGIALTSWMVRR